MVRALHTLSTFGFGAASGVALFVIRPWPAAVPFGIVGLLLCFAMQVGREGDAVREAGAERGRP